MKSLMSLMLLGSLSLFCQCSATAASDDASEKTAINPASVPQERKEDVVYCAGTRNAVRIGQIDAANTDIIFLGDSITHFWAFPETRKNAPGGLEIWDKTYKPLKAVNFGLTADKIENLLWRITEGKQLEGFSPKVIVLLIGVNNTHTGGGRVEMSAVQIAEGIKLIVDTIRQKQPESKILLLGVFPRGGAAFMTKIKEINNLISAYADNQHVFFLDLCPQLLEKDGTMSKEIFRDGLHITPKGYQIWADAMNPLLFKLINKDESKEQK